MYNAKITYTITISCIDTSDQQAQCVTISIYINGEVVWQELEHRRVLVAYDVKSDHSGIAPYRWQH